MKPCFLWQDEFQYFVTRRDNLFQQTCRGARVAVVCLTQNILNLADELGEQQPGSKTKAFTGNLMLKVAFQQNDPDTQLFSADQAGREWRYIPSYGSGSGTEGMHVSGSSQLVHKIEPAEFSRLLKPDGRQPLAAAIVYQGGKHFNATKTRQKPDGTNHLTVHFSRDIK